MTNSAFGKQIQNRNFLSGVAFKFNLTKFPKVDFFSNSARIPELSLELAQQASYLKNIAVPGERLTFGDFTLRFLVDENMENYLSVYNWLTGLGFPESTQDYADLVKPVTAEPSAIAPVPVVVLVTFTLSFITNAINFLLNSY